MITVTVSEGEWRGLINERLSKIEEYAKRIAHCTSVLSELEFANDGNALVERFAPPANSLSVCIKDEVNKLQAMLSDAVINPDEDRIEYFEKDNPKSNG